MGTNPPLSVGTIGDVGMKRKPCASENRHETAIYDGGQGTAVVDIAGCRVRGL